MVDRNLKITVKHNDINKALKSFKRLFITTGILKELKKRTYYIKPTTHRRTEKLKAIRLQLWKTSENSTKSQ